MTSNVWLWRYEEPLQRFDCNSGVAISTVGCENQEYLLIILPYCIETISLVYAIENFDSRYAHNFCSADKRDEHIMYIMWTFWPSNLKEYVNEFLKFKVKIFTFVNKQLTRLSTWDYEINTYSAKMAIFVDFKFISLKLGNVISSDINNRMTYVQKYYG